MDINKRSALHWACAHGNLDQAKIISKLGADIGIIDVEGKTALHWAASSKSSDPEKLINLLVKMKTKGSSSVLSWQDYEGRQPLHLAVMANNPATVKTISQHSSCMVNGLDHRLRSALHWAGAMGLSDIVSILLDTGAKTDLLDESGASPVHLAVQSKNEETVKLFINRGFGQEVDSQQRTPLMWTVALENIELLKLFNNIDLDMKDKLGYTALHVAVGNNSAACVKTLIGLGADLDVANNEGETPLILGSRLGHADIARLLIDNRADIDKVDEQGRNCLHVACSNGHLSLVKYFLSNGMKINLEDIRGRTPLILASYGGHINIVTELLDAGANIDHQDYDGMCSLHWAIRQGHVDIVRLLVDRGAYLDNVGRIREGDSEEIQLTPLDSAIMLENQDIVNLLMENKVRASLNYFMANK